MNNFKYMGTYKKKDYFEGWYFRITDSENNLYAFIFGVSFNLEDQHSFIQVIDHKRGKTYYFRFDINDFYYNRDSVKIKDNVLGLHSIKINIAPFNIDLEIEPTLFLKKGIFSRHAMGAIKCLPLKTYHEIVFLNAKVEGTLKNDDENIAINGNGYMEKNYGTMFPKKWLWIQTNSFKDYKTSLVLGVAELINNCEGFFCIMNVDGEEFRFATYNGFRINHEQNGDTIKVTIEKDNISLIINLNYVKGYNIIAPVCKGKMEKEIEESQTSSLTLSLYRENELIYHDTATNVACENLY